MGESGKAQLLDSRRVYTGRLVKLDVDRVVEPSGMTVEREVLRHPGAAVLLPVTRDRNIVLVRQYRYAVDEFLLEAPAGTIDPGEQPDETARRELVEETGYYPHHLEKLTEFYPSPGVLEECMHLFVASELERRVGSLDDDESLEPVEIPLERAASLEPGKDVRDAKTIIALTYLRFHPLFV